MERTQLTVDGQGTVYYEYDAVGNMAWVLDGATDCATYYDYDGARRIVRQQHPNATATYFSYDDAGRLAEKVTKVNADGSVLVRFAYARDAAGNPVAIERESGLGVFYYEYDALQRLAYEGQFVSAAREYENYYEYDAAGNRTLLRHGETDAGNLTYYDYNAANELTALHDKDGWSYFAYDANGNAVEEQTPGWTRYFDWDGRDMLVGVRSTEDGWTDNEYRYDGAAARVCTVQSEGFTYYDWDGIDVLQEKDGSGDVTERQVHGYAPIVSVGDIALMEAGDSAYVPVADQVGTVWGAVDAEASLANSYEYDAFGVARLVDETFGNPFRFAGKPLDADPSLYHFIARQYDPRVGRFLSRDVGLGGIAEAVWVYGDRPVRVYVLAVRLMLARMLIGNLHTMVQNRPLSSVDPDGAWLSDLHRGKTTEWAQMLGAYDRERGCTLAFREDDPPKIGAGCQDVDDNADTSSTPPHNYYSWHFNVDDGWANRCGPMHAGEDVRRTHIEDEFSRAESYATATTEPDCDRAMYHLGRALHPLQDTFAHQNGNPAGHHAATPCEHQTGPNFLNWTRPDRMALWPADVERAHAFTQELLTRFLRLKCNRCIRCLETDPVTSSSFV